MQVIIKDSIDTLNHLAILLRGDKMKTASSLLHHVVSDLKKLLKDEKHFDIVENELIRQEYAGNNSVFSAGTCDGAGVDTVYIRLEKNGEEPTQLFLRPDEMAAIAWLCNGVLWSLTVDDAIRGTIPKNIAD